MKRRIFIGLILAMILSLSGCSNADSTENTTTGSITQDENENSENKENRTSKQENESKKKSKNNEVSLEALECLEVASAEDFEFMIDGMNPDGLSLCGYKGKSEMVVIPEEVDGKKVVSIIGYAFGKDCGVKAVKIPDSVVGIYEGFTDNKELKYIIFGSGLKEIGDCSFQGCDSLERVELNEGLEELGANAFWGIDNLIYVYVPESVTKIANTAIGTSIPEKFVIAGKAGSKVEEYAKEMEYTFKAVE